MIVRVIVRIKIRKSIGGNVFFMLLSPPGEFLIVNYVYDFVSCFIIINYIVSGSKRFMLK